MNNYLMKFNEIQAGIAYKHSWLKRELDGLNPGDTIYCNINMPENPFQSRLRYFFYRKDGKYNILVESYPSRTPGKEFDYDVKSFATWDELVDFCRVYVCLFDPERG